MEKQMSKYIVDLWLDGYEDEQNREEAQKEFIYEQLNMTASSVKVETMDELLLELKTCYNTFKEYESIHLAKGPEGEAKAKRNRDHADRLKKIIDQYEG